MVKMRQQKLDELMEVKRLAEEERQRTLKKERRREAKEKEKELESDVRQSATAITGKYIIFDAYMGVL